MSRLPPAQRAALYRLERQPGARIHHSSAMALQRRGLIERATPATSRVAPLGFKYIESLNDGSLTWQEIEGYW